ncbi:MAG: ROK family protein [Candidatus Spyradocola sp.]|jgi:glucokinase
MGVYVGLDIGGTKCAAVIGALEGEDIHILAREAFATPRAQEEAMERLCGLAGKLSAGQEILGVGISSGGPMDAETGVLCNPPNLPGWSGLSLTDFVSARLHAPAVLENDANACALAEWRFGAGKGSRLLLFLTFGTGLGAGIVHEGRILRGANGNAGELGHWRMADCGPAGYGKLGSFEGFCSGGGIAQLARAYGAACAQRGTPVPWMEGEITAKSVAAAAHAGDAAAREVFRESARVLGQGLALAVDLLNPDCIVIGSVYARSEDLFAQEMRRVLEREALPQSLAVCRISPAQLGDRIGDYAALSLAVEAGTQK